MCGGSGPVAIVIALGAGLSPRVRGKRRGAVLQAGGVGSIPACAGEACGKNCNCRSAWVYPRVCRGSSVNDIEHGVMHGLSPRVRGKLFGDVR